ncbi:MAG: peptidylprolyl isomerase [Gammaproteobacteria bacterium]|nr:peptidylprolyl isomerase [Gammaproteobacteria bacterium]
MKISKNSVVTINYTLKNDQGETLDESQDNSFLYLHGSGGIIPGLEGQMEGKSAGDEFSAHVEPEDGYGVRDDSMVQVVPRNMFESDHPVEEGIQFHAESPEGDMLTVTVTKIEGDEITVDGNHPLAGIALNFDIKISDVREASKEEIEHGHAHGPDGHHHH